MKLLFPVILLLFVLRINGQPYIVTHITGNVYHNKKPLKLKDRLDDTAGLQATSRRAEVGFLHSTRGRVMVSFNLGKPVQQASTNKNSELYSLTLQEYVRDYTMTKRLTRRGEVFDFVDFFEDTIGVGSPIPLLIVPGKGISLVSNK